MINITFPDGTVRQYEQGSSAIEIARSISEGLARKILATEVNDEVWDLSRPINKDASIKFLTWEEESGKSTFWHSSAHLMAEAVEDIFPGVKFWVGPPVEKGFYYDMDLGENVIADSDLEKIENKMALRVVQNALITLDECRVPEANRLQNAHSFRDTAKVLRLTRAGVAWIAVGCARGAYEVALCYAQERKQFGRPIGGFQLVQDLLVKMLGNITASECMVAQLSQLQDAGALRDEHASLAKAFCTVRMRETVGYARELLGGNGILLEHHVGRFVADAEAIYSYEGTREMNTLIVGRAITGLSAFV